jgi:hypothetical protein
MTKPETRPHQLLAEALAAIVCAAIAARFFRREKPATGGDVAPRECLVSLADFLHLAQMPAEKRWFDEHVRVIAGGVVDDFEGRGVPHSFVAPTWNRDGAQVLGDHIASANRDGPVVRVVVFEEANHLPRIAVLYSPRFAAEGSPAVAPPA